METWGRDGSATAELAVARLMDLEGALHQMPVDWLLEPKIEVTDLGWHAHARFLYPFIERSWLTTPFKVGSPHAESPLCKVLYEALKHLGEPVKSAKAVADLLLKSSSHWPQDTAV